MKRLAIAVTLLLLLATIVGWYFGTFTSGATRNSGQTLALVACNLMLGLMISFGLLWISIRALRSRLKPVSKQIRRAVTLTFAMLGFSLSIVLNMEISRPLRFVFGDLKESSHHLIFRTGDWLMTIFSWAAGIAFVYAFYFLYEEWIGHRSRAITPVVTAKERRALLIKLVLGAVVVWLLTQATMTGEWVESAQYAVESDLLTGGEIGRDRNDSMVFVYLNNGPMSHETYLEGIRRIGAEVDRQGAKVKLVILPQDLVQSSHINRLVEQIAQQGNVVFAVPPLAGSEDNEHWVQHPTRGATEIDWGVASVVEPRAWFWSMRFFPHSYRERDKGYEVPEAALRVVRRFWGEAGQMNGMVKGSRFTLGPYSTDLFKDGSAPIVRVLKVWKVPSCEVQWGEENDTLWYLINNQRLTSLAGLSGTPFMGKIVILDPRGSPGFPAKGETYGRTAAVIIHQILRGYSHISLDTWKNWMVLASQVVAIALMLYLQPVIASILIFLFAFGQPFLYAWIVSHTGYIPPVMPPTLTAWWSVLILLFVRVFHERRRTELKEKKRAEEELRTAHDMQMGLMPTSDPIVRGFDISGICKPADEVGGDYFDYVWLDDKKSKLGIAVADVSGKAMKAAITAVMTSGMVYREVGTNETPKGILRRINKPIYLKTDRRIFTAMSFAVIHIKRKKMAFSNAGQMQPLLMRGGKIQTLKVDGAHLPLGMAVDVEYRESALQLRKGDMVVFYTDGIPEAMNNKNEMFGFEGLETIVKESSGDLSAKQVAARIVEKVAEFAGSAKQHDDMTVVVVRVL